MVFCFLEFTWGGGELPTQLRHLSAPGRKVRFRHSPVPPSGFFNLHSEGLHHLPSFTSAPTPTPAPCSLMRGRGTGYPTPQGPFRILGYQFQVLCGGDSLTLGTWNVRARKDLKNHALIPPSSEWSNLSLCINYTQRFGRSIFI